jgi:MoxR-like ATPase
VNHHVNLTADLEAVAAEAAALTGATRENLAKTLVDLDDVVTLALIAVVGNGHALLEGVPGTAKTTMCRSLATVLGLNYRRIQFTPDLLPSDVTGTRILDRQAAQFVFQEGPIFCQFLLADELNRAPARTQSALLEAMQERQVTVEGETHRLARPFVVFATQNPVEQEGVYRLPEAQLDRFLFRIRVGYPSRTREVDLLELQEKTATELWPLWNGDRIQHFQDHVDRVYGAKELKEYIVDLVRASREHPDVLLGASPRAAIFLQRAARTRALLDGRVYFTDEDVQAVMHPVLDHRLIVRPETELSGGTAAEIIDDIIRSVPVRGEA